MHLLKLAACFVIRLTTTSLAPPYHHSYNLLVILMDCYCYVAIFEYLGFCYTGVKYYDVFNSEN